MVSTAAPALGITAVVLYYVLLADSVDNLVTNYIEAEYQSEGAAIRLAMNAVPAGEIDLGLLAGRGFEAHLEGRAVHDAPGTRHRSKAFDAEEAGHALVAVDSLDGLAE